MTAGQISDVFPGLRRCGVCQLITVMSQMHTSTQCRDCYLDEIGGRRPYGSPPDPLAEAQAAAAEAEALLRGCITPAQWADLKPLWEDIVEAFIEAVVGGAESRNREAGQALEKGRIDAPPAPRGGEGELGEALAPPPPPTPDRDAVDCEAGCPA